MKYLLIFLFSACSSAGLNKSFTQKFTPLTLKIYPGQIRYLEVKLSDDFDQESVLSCHGEKTRFELKDNLLKAYVRYSYFSPKKNFKCIVKNGSQELILAHFIMDPVKYPSERINVDRKTIDLSPKNKKRAWKEQQFLNKVYGSSPSFFYFKEPFQEPLTSDVTSIYGKKRLYNNKKQSQHLGTDYRAPTGTKIPAANRGKVVVARDLFYTGNTVSLDHGFGLFTVYGHMSKLLVKEGDVVNKGDILGLSGSTGRSTGPHLHWGARVNGQYVDGPMLVKESKKQFKNMP